MFRISGLFAVLSLVGFASAASAATVNFAASGFTDQDGNGVDTAFSAVVSDLAPNTVSFGLSLNTGSLETGDILSIGFGLEQGSVFSASTTFTNVTTNTGDGITAICLDTSCSGKDFGFKGGLFKNFSFGAAVQIGDNGSSSGLNTLISFDITDADLTALAFSAIGLRIQTVGPAPVGGGGSLKLINQTPITPMPLPAAGWMLLAALFGMFGFKRMQRRASV